MQHFRFLVHPELLAIARLEADAQLPAWAGGGFLNVARTAGELSIVCAQRLVPSQVLQERERVALCIEGTVPMTTIGVIAELSTALAAAKVSIFVISTYDTDWLLVRAQHFDATRAALQSLGHRVIGELPRA